MNQRFPIASFEAIGTHWWIGSYRALPDIVAQKLATELELQARRFDTAYSRFKPDSLVSQLNKTGQLAHPPAELVEMLRCAERTRQLSNGVFNVAVGGPLERLGYDAQYGFRETGPVMAITQSAVATLGPKLIELQPGITIDLGGLGKGWLIDLLASQLGAAGVEAFYVNGGGDIIINSPEYPQTLALENPFAVGEAIGEISVEQGAVACSAPHKRSWQSPETGRHYHHLINPASGRPHNGPAAVHTFGATALGADIASTVLYLAPESQREALAEKLQVEYLVVMPDGVATSSPGYPGRLYRA